MAQRKTQRKTLESVFIVLVPYTERGSFGTQDTINLEGFIILPHLVIEGDYDRKIS